MNVGPLQGRAESLYQVGVRSYGILCSVCGGRDGCLVERAILPMMLHVALGMVAGLLFAGHNVLPTAHG